MKKSLLISFSFVLPLVGCGTKSVENYQGNNSLALKTNQFGSDVVLSKIEYNHFYDEMKASGKLQIGLAIIANHEIYEEIIDYKSGEKVWNLLLRSQKMEFKYNDSSQMGVFINSFKEKDLSNWQHGTRESKNYGDYYPMYYINHEFSQFGASNWIASPYEIYELSYDDK